MKVEIHPTYFPTAAIKCACGKAFSVGSTVEKTEVELCSNCHPFYTGKQKIVDTERRVEKFQTRATKVDKESLAKKKAKIAKRNESSKTEENEK